MATKDEQHMTQLKRLLAKRHENRRQVLNWAQAQKRNGNPHYSNRSAPNWPQYEAAELALAKLLLEMELAL